MIIILVLIICIVSHLRPLDQQLGVRHAVVGRQGDRHVVAAAVEPQQLKNDLFQ